MLVLLDCKRAGGTTAAPRSNPSGPTTGTYRVHRGGGRTTNSFTFDLARRDTMCGISDPITPGA